MRCRSIGLRTGDHAGLIEITRFNKSRPYLLGFLPGKGHMGRADPLEDSLRPRERHDAAVRMTVRTEEQMSDLAGDEMPQDDRAGRLEAGGE